MVLQYIHSILFILYHLYHQHYIYYTLFTVYHLYIFFLLLQSFLFFFSSISHVYFTIVCKFIKMSNDWKHQILSEQLSKEEKRLITAFSSLTKHKKKKKKMCQYLNENIHFFKIFQFYIKNLSNYHQLLLKNHLQTKIALLVSF